MIPRNAPLFAQRLTSALMCLCFAYLLVFGPAKVSADEARAVALAYYTALAEEDWTTVSTLFQPHASIQVRAEYGGAAEPDGYDTTATNWAEVAGTSGGGWGFASTGAGLSESNWTFAPADIAIESDGTYIRIDHSSDYDFQGYKGQATGHETLTLTRYYGRPVITALKSYKSFGE
ncbi:hypothetical protein ROA7450_02835 [Roseovarius albus]|uniref:SnoaL-like domain-containing protein n=1 Tax=Roseovarius albus TaxID=1247867 RepID=A0A1X6ZLN4_9RHOB|nr:hypothetical protein [Roseovarius albus]SLN55056.1 hypothetical protein ROA7450_02835 [Roseovarius albus]